MPDLRKPNFNTKIITFDKCHNVGNCERGDPLRLFNILSVAKFQKIEGGLFGVFNKKIFEKNQMKNFNGSLIVSKNLKKRDPLGFFNIRCCKTSNKEKGGPFVDIKNF